MPATYQELLTETLPAIIENDEQYGEIHSRLGRLIGKGRNRTPEETKLMRVLGLLVQDYDTRHGMPPEESTAAERLQFLLEHSGKTSADLLPVFGQRSHAHEALTGKRPISAAQARKLGEMFSMNPNLFL
jgi:antitoxin component HigA of HigAB toxin-antitoxin module